MLTSFFLFLFFQSFRDVYFLLACRVSDDEVPVTFILVLQLAIYLISLHALQFLVYSNLNVKCLD